MASGRNHVEPFYGELGRSIATCRLAKNLSQKELARRIGLSRTTLVNIERGSQRILTHTMVSISAELGVGIQELVPAKSVGSHLDLTDDEAREVILSAIPELTVTSR